eukprot:12618034-Alexandrium_andersonii.AAC.1
MPAEIVQRVHARAAHVMRWQQQMVGILELRDATHPLPHRCAGFTAAELQALTPLCPVRDAA